MSIIHSTLEVLLKPVSAVLQLFQSWFYFLTHQDKPSLFSFFFVSAEVVSKRERQFKVKWRKILQTTWGKPES